MTHPTSGRTTGYQPSPPASAHDTITKVIKELRAYNPQADEHGGKFIHKGWANQLEAVAPPQISESDTDYWVRNRALILRAIEDRGFRLVSSGGLFWLHGPSHPAQAGAVPLTDGQVESLLYKYGYDPDDEHMAAMLKEANGIKGGPHGTE